VRLLAQGLGEAPGLHSHTVLPAAGAEELSDGLVVVAEEEGRANGAW